MTESAGILKRAREVFEIEARGILALADRLDDGFIQAVHLFSRCKGKVVVTGLGKSGLICRKIAATFSSTGTPSLFLHAGDGIHGDLGMVMKDDIVLAISNSGETDEILKLLPIIKRMGLKLIAISGNPESTLSRAADIVLNAAVKEEACPLGLAPTASTTAALAIGDALAVIILEQRGFKEEDFAALHPGGALGRRLLLKVEDLMHRGAELPVVSEATAMKDALLEITSKRLGVTAVVNSAGNLTGVITDGDLRRGLETRGDIFCFKAVDLMSPDPKTISPDALAAHAVAIMERHSITSLFVLENDHRPVGVVHLHDLLKAGII